MPFTGSHPIAVLPLRRLGLPASALVIGSMVPDLSYYLPGRPTWPSHTPLGLVTVDLAAGLVVWAIWTWVVRDPVMGVAPAGLQARVGERPRRGEGSSLRRVAALVSAVLVGAATHVIWDEFTHIGRWGDQHVPILHAQYGPMPGWHWAQYLSGAVGLAGLVWCTWRWWQATPPRYPAAAGQRGWAWIVLGVALVVGVLGAVDPGMTLRKTAFAAATGGLGTAGGVGLVLAVTATIVDGRNRSARD